ncbi:formyltransferase family protein [Jatrophihabitans lederbergiae]|uniref:Formyltransferase family protein n=1 Tax=Jatrophihabitans lederbergiae TaxID=3075547 RepID=A0ABU2JHC3_9ACTN|nr:formyltransferase family protein [Jatrophihabitans sp. DSM 44399]MDT0264390.1 formyltransferase family protein [Jatrophihabitans sp. DSM 44399]
MNVYLSGQGGFGVAVAEAVVGQGHTIVGIAAPQHRKRHSYAADGENPMTWDRLRSWAYSRGIEWTPASDLRAQHIPDKTDVVLAAHSHAFIGRRTRARARVAAIGYYPSLLPLHRSRDAVRWTIRDADRVTGGSVYQLTECTDAGAIAAEEHVIVPPRSTAESLWCEQLAPWVFASSCGCGRPRPRRPHRGPAGRSPCLVKAGHGRRSLVQA